VISTRIVLSFSVIGGLLCFVPASGETIQGIVRGTVTMRDGTAPPFTVGIQRLCSDGAGSTPGPLTDKKTGEYLWRMDFDTTRTRVCVLLAAHDGYISTEVDISAINPVMDHNIKLAPIVLTPRLSDPYLIMAADDAIPSKGLNAWRAAMKAIDQKNALEAEKQLQAVVAAVPKLAVGWHTLAEARDAYQHAIEADPKMLQPYDTLARVCIRSKDWEAALKTADALIKIDKKDVYPEIYLHRAVAQYQLKDVAGAEMGVQEVIRKDSKRGLPRAEYVLGRILETKGDLNGAREHMTKYLELDPKAPDADVIKVHLQGLGKPDAATVDPQLELL
jgi:hypothetical protein